MSMINISNLTFGYGGADDNIFENVSFRMDTDWKLGFTGRNGRGKTTFLNLLLGKFKYQGSISASVDFEYFPYFVENQEQMTLDILAELSGNAEDWEIMREMNRLEVEADVLYREFSTLSKGEQTKVLLAAMFLKENSFLLIDEPTNHLDMNARKLVSEYLRTKKGFILVSHDREFLDGCVDHILSINKTDIEIQQGNFSSWYYNKTLSDNYEIEQNENLKKEIQRLTATSREKAQWADTAERRKIGIDPNKVDNKKGYRPLQGAKSKKAMARAKALETRQQKTIEEKQKLLKNIEVSEPIKLVTEEFHSKRFIEFINADFSYGDKEIFRNLSFTVNAGDRIALRGKNGCGKSTLIKILTENYEVTNGEVFVAKGLKISYIPQDTSFLHGSLADFEEENQIDKTLFRAILRQLDFSREHFEKSMDEYSAGQRKKVLIAKSLSERANLYIWDEPLNYIDVLSRIQIEELITEYEPTLIFVEHDSAFCENIATKTINL